MARDWLFVEHGSRNGHVDKLQALYYHTWPKVEIFSREAHSNLFKSNLVHYSSKRDVGKQERIDFHELLDVEVELRQPEPLDREQKYYYACGK